MKITVELPKKPEAGAFAGSPSGDTDYEWACNRWRNECNAAILDAADGKSIQSVAVSEQKIVRHIATIELD